jgi:hypothetical protein
VPGQTSHYPCSALFDDWSRVLGISTITILVANLRRQYEQVSTHLRSAEIKAAKYETVLSANCKISAKIKSVRRYTGVHDHAQAMAVELDKRSQDLSQLRGIKITIE